MSVANIYLGVGVNFGVAGTTGISGTGIGSAGSTFGTLTTQKHSKGADKDVMRAATGSECQATIYNPTEMATFEYFCTSDTGADAITNTTIPLPGTKVTVTNGTQYPAIAGTAWFVWDDPQLDGTNTACMKVTLHLKRWQASDGISAVST